MDRQNGDHINLYSRRDVGKLALASLPVLLTNPLAVTTLGAQGKPNSVVGGVPIGIVTPCRFGPEASTLVPALNTLVQLGPRQARLGIGV